MLQTKSTENLNNSVLKISDRALAVLTLLSRQFDGEDSYLVNHKIVHAAICSVMNDVKKVNVLVIEHHLEQRIISHHLAECDKNLDW